MTDRVNITMGQSQRTKCRLVLCDAVRLFMWAIYRHGRFVLRSNVHSRAHSRGRGPGWIAHFCESRQNQCDFWMRLGEQRSLPNYVNSTLTFFRFILIPNDVLVPKDTKGYKDTEVLRTLAWVSEFVAFLKNGRKHGYMDLVPSFNSYVLYPIREEFIINAMWLSII
jgi:hypothetical protein